MSGKQTVDRVLTVLAAAAAPLLAILTRHGVITPADAEDVGYVIAATVGAYHGGAAIERRHSKPAADEVYDRFAQRVADKVQGTP